MSSPGLEINVAAQLSAALDRNTAALDREAQWRARCAQVVRQIPIAPPQMALSGGAGTLDVPDLLAAKTGYCWGVRRLTTSGWTGGSIIAYLNSASGEPVMSWAQAGVATIGRAELLMHPGDRLIFVASGITSGVVQVNGSADCFESWYLPYYIG